LGTASADSVWVWPYPAAASNNTGAAMVICPGGAYDHLALDKEGHAVAAWFQARGVSAFVLKYRLGSSGYHYPTEIDDGRRAVRWLRANAARYHVDPNRVGMTGFSAGGHLTSTVGTHYDSGTPAAADTVERKSCRPDFMILVYAVITMDAAHTNSGTRTNLIGANPSPDLVALLSNEKHVTAQIPPTFLSVGLNDALVQNSQVFADSCKAHGVPHELHPFADGPHGFGLADGQNGAPDIPATAMWPGMAMAWLQARGFLSPATAIAPSPWVTCKIPWAASGRRAAGWAIALPGTGLRDPAGRRIP
jgi:acetyl esterase/lipase